MSLFRGSWVLLTFREKLSLLSLAIARVLNVVLEIFVIALLGLVSAQMLGATSSENLSPQIPRFSEGSEITLLVLILIAYCLKALFAVLLTRLTESLLARIQVRKSRIIAEKVFSFSLADLKARSRAEITWMIIRSTETAFHQVLGTAMVIFSEMVSLTLVVAFIVLVDWQMALAVLLYLSLIVLVVARVSSPKVFEAGNLSLGNTIGATEVIVDVLSAYPEITVARRSGYFLALLHDSRQALAKSLSDKAFLGSIPRQVLEIAGLFGALIVFILLDNIEIFDLSVGALVVTMLGTLRLVSAFSPVLRGFQDLSFSRPQAQAAQIFLQELPNLGSSLEPKSVDTVGGLIDFPPVDRGLSVVLNQVSFCFENSVDSRQPVGSPSVRNAVSDVSLEVEPGSFVGLVGPSGAGKSAVVSLILGLLDPTSGSVSIGGLAPKNLLDEFPGLVAYVPQKPGLIAGTLRQNIALGIMSDEVSEDRVWSALESVRLDRFVESLPDGLDTYLGRHADALSGGQAQRVGIARALYLEPKLLILDEATSALDAKTESFVANSLLSLRGSVTLIVVSHRMSTIRNADKIFVMESGTIAAQGTFANLRREVTLIKEYARLMSLEEPGDGHLL